jgi:hypothetical protein
MFIILLLFLICVPLSILSSTTAEIKNYGFLVFIWAAVAIFIFLLSATRVGGADWENYEYLYLYMSDANDWLDAVIKNAFFEPGYVVLNYVFNLVSDNRRLLVVFESAINSYAIWLVLTRFKGGPIILLWLFPLQFANILGVRQTLATSFFIIAITIFKGRLSFLLSVSSGLIHISSLLLVIGRSIQTFRPNSRRIILGLSLIFLWYAFTYEFLEAKLANYFNNASELSGLSGSEVFFGKGLTILTLFGLEYIALSQPKRASQTLLAEQKSSKYLYIAYLVIIAATTQLPALARLLTPFELLIVWNVCEAVSNVGSRSSRAILTSAIAAISFAKMIKIWVQFGEMYSVCFFCA